MNWLNHKRGVLHFLYTSFCIKNMLLQIITFQMSAGVSWTGDNWRLLSGGCQKWRFCFLRVLHNCLRATALPQDEHVTIVPRLGFEHRQCSFSLVITATSCLVLFVAFGSTGCKTWFRRRAVTSPTIVDQSYYNEVGSFPAQTAAAFAVSNPHRTALFGCLSHFRSLTITLSLAQSCLIIDVNWITALS